MTWKYENNCWKEKEGKSLIPLLLPDPDNHRNTTFWLGHHTAILTGKALVSLLKATFLLPLHSDNNDKHEILHQYYMIKFLLNFAHHCLLQLEGSVSFYQHCLQETEESYFLDSKEKCIVALWQHDESKKRLGMSLQHLQCLLGKHFEEEAPSLNFSSVQLCFHLKLLHGVLVPISQATVHCINFSNIRKKLHSRLNQSQRELRIWWNFQIDEELARDPLSLKTFFQVSP